VNRPKAALGGAGAPIQRLKKRPSGLESALRTPKKYVDIIPL